MAKRRGLEFNITLEFFKLMLFRTCVYCSLTPALGVDRADNNLGYIVSNVWPCCKTCNRAKSTRSDVDFVRHCRRVVQQQIAVSDKRLGNRTV